MTETLQAEARDDFVERPSPDRTEMAGRMAAFLGREPGTFTSCDAGAVLFEEWLRTEIRADDPEQFDDDAIEIVLRLLRHDYALAATPRQLWSVARSLTWFTRMDEADGPEPSISMEMGRWYVTWTEKSDTIERRIVLIDSTRQLPKGMRRWFERAGIYQCKRYGLHRRWRRDRFIFGSSRSRKLAEGTRDGKRNFRVYPHLDQMYVCDGNFDRWANSTAATVPMPRTQAEFDAAIERLLYLSAPRLAVIERNFREYEERRA